MIYKEIHMDLFDVTTDYTLCHCISKDCALGKGIAKTFAKKYPDMRDRLKTIVICNGYSVGDAILYENNIFKNDVINLITKEKYWHKPTYDTLRQALVSCKTICRQNNITRLAMPMIGCGLDRLKWNKVSKIIQEVFDDMSIEILVCIR